MLENLVIQEKLAFNARNSCIDARKPSDYIDGMDTIHTRIRAAREAKGFSMEQLAALVGVKAWQTVQQWENGNTAPARKRLSIVAKVLEKTPDFLLNGVEEPSALLTEDHAGVPLVDAKASAGRGELVFSTDVAKVLMFRRDFLSKSGAKPEDVVAFPVKGDSMVDAHIVDGSVVIANRKMIEPLEKRFYVMWLRRRLWVKQLVKKDGRWFARSHNAASASDYPDIEIDIDDRIVGRAFWVGFSL